jgi:hypothetical protein
VVSEISEKKDLMVEESRRILNRLQTVLEQQYKIKLEFTLEE